MEHNAQQTTIKGRLSLEGIHTVFGPDGKTVKDQKAIVKLEKGILSKRFWLPLSLFSVDEIVKTFQGKGDRLNTLEAEITVANLTKVPGRRRTYEGNLHSMTVPLSAKVVESLVSSQAIVKKPTRTIK
ncbi:hypothetical protein EGT07_23785 [Herbaspirillum sp. HC18]|nr:hypothetical protein EGT07_23785 [Herbaspirillum sp. HC18]